MKIYTRVVMSLKTGNVLEADSYEYKGPVVECKGGGKSPSTPEAPPTPPKPATGKEVTAATTEAVGDQQRRVKAYFGQQGSILTSPLGAQQTQQQGKSLLGM